MLSAIDLRHDLAKQQEQERQQDGDDKELKSDSRTKPDHMVEEIITEHNDGDIDHIVGDQNGCQRTL